MSVSFALQALIYARLTSYAPLTTIIGSRVADKPLSSMAFPCITFGPSDVVTDDYQCIAGRVETIQLDCWSRAQDGFREVKEITDHIKAALHLYQAEPASGALALMRVDMIRVFRDPDGQTSHGVVMVECTLEDA